MLDTFLIIGEIASVVIALSTLSAIFIKPIRERIFNSNITKEGERCLLRSEMLRIYYANETNGEIRQFEKENFNKLYSAYKALDGNSFIEDVNEEIKTWRVIR